MKLIQVHNYYQQAGGEDVVVAAERDLLEKQGNIVVPFYKTNEGIPDSGNHLLSVGQLIRVAAATLWNHQVYREFRKVLKKEMPDLVHCHNTFPLISPSIYWACAKEGVPVVQTLHNYRLLCLNACLFRTVNRPQKGGELCELCVHKSFKWPGIRYSCYRNSKAGSLVVGLMLLVHQAIGTWSKRVTAYITLTEFQKQKMIEGGIPADKIRVKSNFIQKPGASNGRRVAVTSDLRSTVSERPPFALFVGRLSPEKGCDVLVRAWSEFSGKWQTENGKDGPVPQLFIVGDGPERESIEALAASLMPCAQLSYQKNIHFSGKKLKHEVRSLMCRAQFLVSPSLWYEGYPLTMLEAFSKGLPVIASNISSTVSAINSGKNGLVFDAGRPDDLSEKIEWAFAHPNQLRRMGEQALQDFEAHYSAVANGRMLTDIYRQVCGPEGEDRHPVRGMPLC